jgi:predicted enzyme related to lactoylglutathione lyase
MRSRKEHAMPERDGYLPGVPCWVDTSQPDPDAAAAFNRALFGWQTENTMPPGSEAKYLVARLRGGDVAAISSPPAAAGGPVAWNTYIWVDSADDTTAIWERRRVHAASDASGEGYGGSGGPVIDVAG